MIGATIINFSPTITNSLLHVSCLMCMLCVRSAKNLCAKIFMGLSDHHNDLAYSMSARIYSRRLKVKSTVRL